MSSLLVILLLLLLVIRGRNAGKHFDLLCHKSELGTKQLTMTSVGELTGV